MVIAKGQTFRTKTANLPNILTIIRILLTPLIIVFLTLRTGPTVVYLDGLFEASIWRILGFALFIFCALTDFFDGWWARKYNLVTNFGKFFDPIADKFLVNGTLITITVCGSIALGKDVGPAMMFDNWQMIPVWITIIYVLRDIVVDGSRMIAAKNQIVVAAVMLGKLKTVFQLLGISFLLLFGSDLYAKGITSNDLYVNDWFQYVLCSPLLVGLAFSLLSGYQYFAGIGNILFKDDKKDEH